MKILYVITQLGVGGAEAVLVSMAKEMVSLGFEVQIVSLLRINEQKFGNNISVHILDLKNKPFLSIIQIRNIIKSFKPDVIHSHCLHANLVMRLIKIFSPVKKLVTTAHNTFEGQGLIMTAFKYTNFLSDVITNVSTDAVKTFEMNKYVKLNQMKVVFNVVDIHKFEFSQYNRDKYRSKFSINKDEVVLIAVGSMKDSKDYPNLLHALNLVKEKNIKKFKTFIVGDGPLFCEIKELALKLELEPDVVFLGNRSDVNALLSMADIFVLSSRHEGLPTVLIEAAMARNIIISTDCGGINDLLPSRENIVDIENPKLLAEKINEVLLLSVDSSSKQIEATYQFIRDKLNPKKITKEWVEIYQS